MAKRYTIKHAIQLGTPSAPNDLAWDEWIDLPVKLSQRLQKNIRQGRVIHVHGVQAKLTGSGGNLDLGGAISGTMSWAPATKNTAKAWRHLFSVWRKQKSQIVNGIGPMVRYDDFEVAYNADTINSRTSTVLTTGLQDTTPESVTIYGGSVDGTNVSLYDSFQSAQQQPEPSRFPISNSVVKQSKFNYQFPSPATVPIHASWSTIDAQTSHDSGAQIQSDYQVVRDGASLCGVLVTRGKLLPENVGATVQDDLTLELYITCSIGMPLVKVPSRYGGSRMSKTKWTYGKSRRRAWRTYRKRSRK